MSHVQTEYLKYISWKIHTAPQAIDNLYIYTGSEGECPWN